AWRGALGAHGVEKILLLGSPLLRVTDEYGPVSDSPTQRFRIGVEHVVIRNRVDRPGGAVEAEVSAVTPGVKRDERAQGSVLPRFGPVREPALEVHAERGIGKKQAAQPPHDFLQPIQIGRASW